MEGFDSKAFMNEQFEDRTMDVPVPGLAIWFGEGEKPVFTVKGLTFHQLNTADNKADNSEQMLKLVGKLQAKDGASIGEEIQNAFGIGEDTPPNMVKRINHLVMGCLNPVVDEEFAVKLASMYPVEFMDISNKIITLTGQGFVPGKRKGCTPKQASD